ncbi:Alpha/Beta hydrolase protein [Fusarium oxysporum Fo47]|uniref:Alpha/Beta hydrolase protein n=1 Tax=Fusarium oxysporum Fo47 TaxID=660027 RepID=UPI002869C17A|nr:Alpha/Beta hydrolase protein [Fusarium oxysporum Fo47]QKD63103.2 Alpha/Beta hydrolase protein [Fusarium oxysporum Fo47]
MKSISVLNLGALLVTSMTPLAISCPTAHHGAPIVDLSNGTYRGTYNQHYHRDLFLGMPYAKAPSLNSTWTGIRNTTNDTWVLGNHVSEDCLSINVVRPAGIPEGTKLPVAVWIHGGGWVNGGSSDPRYNLSFIVEQSVRKGMPIIAANMNYRLHAWGFLHSAELAAEGSTNLGYRDQRLALHWIKENIANFGGDSERVTLWGESAGAFSVGSQLVAYGGQDDKLFSAAILQSRSPLLLHTTNCSVAEPVACLRKLPTNELSAVLNSTFASPPSWGQVVDGDFIPASGRALLKKGKFAKVPLLMGTNFDEGTEFAPQGINTTSQFVQYVRSVDLAKPAVHSIEKLYSNNPAVGIPGTLKGRPEGHLTYLGRQYKRAAAFSGDVFQHAGRRLTTQSYHWNVLVENEVVFTFNNVNGQGYDTVISNNPLAGKPAFIINHNPNSYAQSLTWPQYQERSEKNLVFDVNVTGLAYIESDSFRHKQIAYIIDNLYLARPAIYFSRP